MSPQAVYCAVVDTALQLPSIPGSIVLVADDSSGKPVGVIRRKLSSHKCLVQQEGKILLRFIHADDSSGTHSYGIRLIIQIPVSRGTIIHLSFRTVVGSNASQIAVYGQDQNQAPPAAHTAI